MRSAFAAVSLAVLAFAMAAAPASAQEPQRIAGALEDSDSRLPVAAPGSDGQDAHDAHDDHADHDGGQAHPDADAGDAAAPREAHLYDDHRIRLEAGRRYRISLTSDAFDPVARLYRDTGAAPLAENDDSGESLNSRILHTPAATGDFVFRVTGFSAGARGAYAVEVEALPPLPEPATAFQRMAATAWRVYEGAIADSDSETDGKRYDDYRIALTQGQTRLVWVDSTSIDAMVQVYRLDGREEAPLASDDDSGGGLNALLAFTAGEAGDYVVRVTGFDDSERGAYRLRISE